VIVGIVVMGGIVAALHIGKVPPALPLVRADLGLDLVSAGFIVSAFNVLGMTLGLVAGVTADRLGRRRLVGIGFAALVLGGVLGAVGQGVAMLLVSRLLEGLGFIGIAVTSPALVAAVTAPRDRALALSLWSIFTPAGMALALAGAPVVLDAGGWRALWLVVSVLAVLCGAAVLRATAGIGRSAPPSGSSGRTVVACLSRPGLLLLAAVFGAYAFQWIALMVWLPSFLPDAMGVSSATAALLTALVVVMNVPGNLAGGWLLRRGTSATVLIVGAGVVMALGAWGLFSPALPDTVRFALVLVFSLVGGVIPASLFAGVPEEAPSVRHLAAANGVLMQGSNLGQFLGPPLVAAAVTAASGAWTGALGPVLAAAAVTVLLALVHARRPRAERRDVA